MCMDEAYLKCSYIRASESAKLLFTHPSQLQNLKQPYMLSRCPGIVFAQR
jgi:hypothetical protein